MEKFPIPSQPSHSSPPSSLRKRWGGSHPLHGGSHWGRSGKRPLCLDIEVPGDTKIMNSPWLDLKSPILIRWILNPSAIVWGFSQDLTFSNLQHPACLWHHNLTILGSSHDRFPHQLKAGWWFLWKSPGFHHRSKQHEASQRPQNHCPVSRPPVAGPCLQPKPAKSSAYCDVFWNFGETNWDRMGI